MTRLYNERTSCGGAKIQITDGYKKPTCVHRYVLPSAEIGCETSRGEVRFREAHVSKIVLNTEFNHPRATKEDCSHNSCISLIEISHLYCRIIFPRCLHGSRNHTPKPHGEIPHRTGGHHTRSHIPCAELSPGQRKSLHASERCFVLPPKSMRALYTLQELSLWLS